MAAADATASASTITEREIIFTRVFDAPPDVVFDVWTDPKHVAQWWSPDGFTTTIQQMDVKPGGEWRLVMHGPDGTDYKNHIVFLEVVRGERLVYKHVPEKGTEPVSFQATVTFVEEGGRTKLTMHALFPSTAALRHVIKKYKADEGGSQTLGRLRQHLSGIEKDTHFLIPTEKPTITLTRVFDAPRRLVFEAFTKPEHMKRWWGPRDLTMTVCEIDFRVGGSYRFVHRDPRGNEHPFIGEYHEIVPPERLVYSERYDVEPWAKHDSTVIVTCVERDGRTRLTMTSVYASIEIRDGVVKTGMERGARETMDRLAELLAAL